ncbi:MAG: PilZ domain-containing protein [Nitrospirae bacterium]|nr:MAG: PilZ domain-containing protein [Nitrospirota bacterium]
MGRRRRWRAQCTSGKRSASETPGPGAEMARVSSADTPRLRETQPVEDDRRELLRIDDRLLLEYWPFGEAPESGERRSLPQVDEAITAFIARPTTDLLARAAAQEADQATVIEARLAPWLMKVDWALELILKTVARMSPQGLAIPCLTEVNISGGGICFEAPRRFEGGAQLELRIILPPFVPIATVAEVVRVIPVRRSHSDAASRGGSDRFSTAARFASINSEGRERLIRHILHLQAERLRARHMGAAYARGDES